MENQGILNKEVNSVTVLNLLDFAWDEMQKLNFEVKKLSRGSWCARENPYTNQDDIDLALDFQSFAMDLVEERCEAVYIKFELLIKIAQGNHEFKDKLIELIKDHQDYHCQKLCKLFEQDNDDEINLEGSSKAIEKLQQNFMDAFRKKEAIASEAWFKDTAGPEGKP